MEKDDSHNKCYLVVALKPLSRVELTKAIIKWVITTRTSQPFAQKAF